MFIEVNNYDDGNDNKHNGVNVKERIMITVVVVIAVMTKVVWMLILLTIIILINGKNKT